jgi:hypothetical protein
MNKNLEIHCPREEGKRYFSTNDHGYSNSLYVYFNDEIIFGEIDDCEEKLPITLVESIKFKDNAKNVLRFDYNIKFEGLGEERTDVEFVFSDGRCLTTFCRHNWVKGSEKLADDYTVAFELNEHCETFGREWHDGETKQIKFQHDADINQTIHLRWHSRKSFVNNQPPLTYDDIRVRLWN